ncbi:MAG: hypothetical protein Fur0018_12850 [Anaerolineales bacterium]
MCTRKPIPLAEEVYAIIGAAIEVYNQLGTGFTETICQEAYETGLVELKALSEPGGHERAQILNYLKASDLKVGPLVNFGSKKKLQWERFVF